MVGTVFQWGSTSIRRDDWRLWQKALFDANPQRSSVAHRVDAHFAEREYGTSDTYPVHLSTLPGYDERNYDEAVLFASESSVVHCNSFCCHIGATLFSTPGWPNPEEERRGSIRHAGRFRAGAFPCLPASSSSRVRAYPDE